LHAKPHVADAHVAAALARAGHAVPHAPQLAAEVCVLISQPVVAFASQSA
jgi:hypothetical protein